MNMYNAFAINDIIACLLITSADAKHGFSTMNLICTPLRNRLGVERLSNFKFVSLVGPSLDYFNALPYINKNLSCRKQIARQLRRQYDEGIYRPKYYTVTYQSSYLTLNIIVTLKCVSEVTQGH